MELMCIVAVIALIVLIILWRLVGTGTYRPPPPIQYPAMSPPPTPGQIKKEREVSEGLVKVECPNCGTRFEKRLGRCPRCGTSMI
ncbi:MAG: hypothetical protein AYK23_05015 [Candidatus Proteinoplasmatales archaeon SG8-5]|nr:MAG: hypothetical protein AYK23_05015 [Candidatus Proteinoplasmatales archaeon SG8-5]